MRPSVSYSDERETLGGGLHSSRPKRGGRREMAGGPRWAIAALTEIQCDRTDIWIVRQEVERVARWTPGALQVDDLWIAAIEGVWLYFRGRMGRPPKVNNRTRVRYAARDALRQAVHWERRTSALRALHRYSGEPDGWPFLPAKRCEWCGFGVSIEARWCAECARAINTMRVVLLRRQRAA